MINKEFPTKAEKGPRTAFEPMPDRISKARTTDTAGRTNWAIKTVAELVRVRDEITQALPALNLGKFNLEEEVLLQYHTLRELQGSIIGDESIPPNQKSQVANSVAGVLKTLSDMQEALYNSERFKQIESLMVRTLTQLPEDKAAEFIDEYEKILIRGVK